MQAKLAIGLTVLTGILAGAGRPAAAQGLIWTLPEDENVAVVYEGTYVQKDVQPGSAGEVQPIEWRRVLYVKSLRREEAMFEGKPVPCRWIEFKVRTGRQDVDQADSVDAGPAGQRIYKVLVPESKIVDDTVDADGILVSMVPVVKGFRRIGDGRVEPIKSGVLQVYPTISLVKHYRELKQEPGQFDLNVENRQVKATKHSGTHTVENRENRSTSTAELWRSDEVPFGLAKWSVRLVRETKDTSEPRSAFQQAAEITVEMTATRLLRDVPSDLAEE